LKHRGTEGAEDSQRKIWKNVSNVIPKARQERALSSARE